MRTVRLSLVIVVLLAFFGGTAVAGDVEDRVTKIAKLTERRVKADADRKDVEKRYQEKTKEIEKLKGQRSSWTRDDKLKKRLGEARDTAAALDKISADIRAIDTSLRGERTALVKAIDSELAGSATEARKAKLAKLRTETAGLGVALPRKLRVADEDIDPLDDPEDLDDKARALAESEKELRNEEQRLDRRVKYYRKQARLARARTRAEADPFGDDQPRRKKGGTRTQTTGGDDDMGAADPAPPAPEQADTTDGFTGEGGREDVSGGDPAVEYEDVVDPETVDELRRAERSGDPETRAKAAERAKKDIAARAERLKKKRLEIERRARELRGE